MGKSLEIGSIFGMGLRRPRDPREKSRNFSIFDGLCRVRPQSSSSNWTGTAFGHAVRHTRLPRSMVYDRAGELFRLGWGQLRMSALRGSGRACERSASTRSVPRGQAA